MIKQVDINCDMGEDFYALGYNSDHLFMPYISSCNISCGGHSGSPILIEKTIDEALTNSISIGAHPSYPDKANFGRKILDISNDPLIESINQQLDNLHSLVSSKGGKVHHIKAHGALYHQLNIDYELAKSYVQLISDKYKDISIFGAAGSYLENLVSQYQLAFVSEVFADRRYENARQLVSRNDEHATITKNKDLKTHLDHLLNNEVQDIAGSIHSIKTETICIHSDTNNALDICKYIFAYLKENDVEVRPHTR